MRKLDRAVGQKAELKKHDATNHADELVACWQPLFPDQIDSPKSLNGSKYSLEKNMNITDY